MFFVFCCLTTIREIQQQQPLANTAAKYANYYVCISPPCRVSSFFFLPAIFCVFVWRLRLFLLLFYLQLYRYFDILLQLLPTANFTRIYVLIQFAKIP